MLAMPHSLYFLHSPWNHLLNASLICIGNPQMRDGYECAVLCVVCCVLCVVCCVFLETQPANTGFSVSRSRAKTAHVSPTNATHNKDDTQSLLASQGAHSTLSIDETSCVLCVACVCITEARKTQSKGRNNGKWEKGKEALLECSANLHI